jgi:aspartate-semialdehyde dehydrogenase
MSARIAVVGATGAVGSTMLRLLEARGFPASEIVPFASERSAGRTLEGGLVVQPLREDTIGGFDIAIFSAGGGISREWAPKFAAAGAVVVDNSSAWRMDPDVPLVVAEVNPEALETIPKGIVANPNCVAMAILLPLKALHDAFGLRQVVASTYQAAGGAGQKGIDELVAQVPAMFADPERLQTDGVALMGEIEAKVHAKPLAFNVVPWLGVEEEAGYTDEEIKLRNECRKILAIEDLGMSPTCVRVPVMVGHSIAMRATFERKPTVEAALEAMGRFPGLVLDEVPTPLEWAGRNEVAVGRVRLDLADDHSLNLFTVGDNLLKGAALNTIQLAELLCERGLAEAAA